MRGNKRDTGCTSQVEPTAAGTAHDWGPEQDSLLESSVQSTKEDNWKYLTENKSICTTILSQLINSYNLIGKEKNPISYV